MTCSKVSFYFYGLILCLSIHLSFAQLPKAIIEALASREERYHHYLWHLIRDNWNRYDAVDQADIRARGWEPPRPSRRYDSNGNSIAITDNNSGEDFLYMHRQMIAKVKSLAKGNATAIALLTGWKTIPAPGDKAYPVPPQYTIPGNSGTTSVVNNRKTDDYYYDNIEPMENLFTDLTQLKKMTLGELGSRIENTIHSWLHMRFSASESYGYRSGKSGPFPNYNKMWDDPRYDWLGDSYASHVNPMFWKLHGWIDDRIEDWRKANGLSRIVWKGTWVGGPMSTLSDIVGNQATASISISSKPFLGSAVTAASVSIDDSSAVDPVVTATDVSSDDSSSVPESTFADDVQVDFSGFDIPGKM